MRKIIFCALLTAFTGLFFSCEAEMEKALYEKNMQTSREGVLREITIRNARTNEIIFQRKGIAYIDDYSVRGDASILFRSKDGNSYTKMDFLGDFILIAEELEE